MTPDGLIPISNAGLIPISNAGLIPLEEEAPKVGRILYPGMLNNSPDFKPTNSLFVGVRGEGKTLAMVFMEQIMAPSFQKLGWRIQSNFEIQGADFCHPFLGSVISEDPLRAYQSQINVDEVTELIPSRRTMSKVSSNWFTVVRQIRKLRCEIQATTQFPWDIDKQMLRQVELLILCRGYFPAERWTSARAAFRCFIDIYLFDLHGNLRKGAQPVKVYPPPLNTAFKRFRLRNLPYVWNKYRTNDRVASDHASEEVKARMVGQQWDLEALTERMETMTKTEAEWNEAIEGRFAEGANDPSTPEPVVLSAPLQEADSWGGWLAEKRRLGEFPVLPEDLGRAKRLRDDIQSFKDLHLALEVEGWTIEKRGGRYGHYYARWPG